MKRKIKWKMRKDRIFSCIFVLSCICSLEAANVAKRIPNLLSSNEEAQKHLQFVKETFTKSENHDIYNEHENSFESVHKSIKNPVALHKHINIESFTKKICYLWKEYKVLENANERSSYRNIDKSKKFDALKSFQPHKTKSKVNKEASVVVSRFGDSSTSSDLPAGCQYRENDINTNEVICSGSEIKEVPVFKIRHFNKLTFKGTAIQMVDKTAVGRLPRLSELVFSDGVLMDVRFCELLRKQPVLERFSVVHNSISSVSFSMFSIDDEDKESLKYLSFESNMIIFLPEPDIDSKPTLLSLKSLNFNNNPMCVLPGDLFYPLRQSNVTHLYLKKSGLEEIGTPSMQTTPGDSSPLVYLPHLELLDLSNNPYLEIVQLSKLLSPLINGSLISLNLSFNYYIEIPLIALNHVRHSLLNLDLEGLSVSCLDSNSFSRMRHLKSLNLRYSRIAQISYDTFNSLPNLEILFLDGNALLTLPSGMSLDKLKVLSLKNNPSTDLPKEFIFNLIDNTFSEFISLEELYLSNVPLGIIDNNIFRGLSSLIILEVSGSSLTSIEPFCFSELRMLQTLDLSYNEISTVTRDTFVGLSNLTFIDLSHNNIAFEIGVAIHDSNYISNFLFEGNSTLNHIDFDRLFDEAPSLEVMNFSSNRIEHLDPGMFRNLHHLKNLVLGFNKIRSWREPLFKRKYQLAVIILNNNELHMLTSAMRTDFDKFNMTVNLRGNEFLCSCSLTAFDSELNETNFEDKDEYKCFNGIEMVLLETYYETFNGTNCTNLYPTDNLLPPEDQTVIYMKNIIIYGSIFITLVLSIIVVGASYKNRWYAKYLVYKVKVKFRYMNFKPDSENYEYDTFICYSQSDRQWVFEKLVNKLESVGSGLNVCVHERDFLVGEAITHNIIRSVEKSRKVIVVISKSFVRSTWCMFELQMASNKILDERKNKLILLLLEPIEFEEQPKELKLLLKTRTYISWIPEEDGGKLFWARLMRVISKPTSLNIATVSESSDQVSHEETSATANDLATDSTEEYEETASSVDQESIYSDRVTLVPNLKLSNAQSAAYTNESYEISQTLSVENLDEHYHI